MNDFLQEFCERAQARGLILPPGEVIGDGKLHRCDVEGGASGKGDGAYVLHLDGNPAGGFQNHRDGLGWENVSAKRQTTMTPAERAAWRTKIDEQRREREESERKEQAETRMRIAEVLEAQEQAASAHPYAKAKGISVEGRKIRTYRGNKERGGLKLDGSLMVPLFSVAEPKGKLELTAAQFISPEGTKRFWGSTDGAFFPIGKPSDGKLILCEGLATGLSLHEATGLAVFVALNCGNLETVGAMARARYGPDLELIYAADDDWRTKIRGEPVNPGLEAATAAAVATGGTVAVPEFPEDRPDTATDFNDSHRLLGLESVRKAVERRRAPDEATPQPNAANRSTVRLARGDAVPMVPINWLWQDYLPGGKFVLLGGAPGTGKTTLAIGLAAAVTVGGVWPDGTRANAGDVLIWSGEDSVADTLAPRFAAAGADMQRVSFVTGVQTDKGGRPFDPSQDFPELAKAAAGIPNLRLIIVDPVVMAVAGDSHKNAETRRGLQPLVDFAESTGAVVVGVTHFSKGTQGKEPIERITGSLAFAAVARLILVAAKIDEANGGGRVLVRSKSNLGPDGGGFKYELEQVELVPGVNGSRVRWGAAIDGNARDILATAEVSGDPSDKEETQGATEWLRAILEDGELLKGEVMRRAREAGFSDRTIQRARERIGAVAEVTGFGAEKRSVWKLKAATIHATDAPFVPIVPALESGTHGTNGGMNDSERF